MKKINLFIFVVVIIFISGCSKIERQENQEMNDMSYFSKDTKVIDVINNKSFKSFGKLIFPVDRTIDKNMTLEEAEDLYVWYNYITPNKTVEIVNYMKEQADSGKQIFYSIYTEEEIALAGIDALGNFIKEIGLPTTFKEMNISDEEMLKKVAFSSNITAGCCKKLTHEEIFEILKECL